MQGDLIGYLPAGQCNDDLMMTEKDYASYKYLFVTGRVVSRQTELHGVAKVQRV